MSTSDRPLFQWVDKTFAIIRNKQFDFMFFQSKNDENDENSLIDGKPAETETAGNKKMWRDFCSIIDKIALIVVTIVYVVMCFTLIPMKYGKNSNPILLG
jgi:hypothetical protein